MSQRLRWAVFTRSIISDSGNPDAHLFRALGIQLATRGHEAIFLEERGNPALRSLLKASGARAIDAFRSQYPEIEYRTFDSRPSSLLAEWLVQTLATFDLVLIQRDAPADLVYWVGRFTRGHLQTYLVDSGFEAQPTELQISQLEPRNFSGVLIGDSGNPMSYREWVPESKIVIVGSLRQPEISAHVSTSDDWARMAGSLINVVLERFFRDRAQAAAGVQSNGHSRPELM